MGFDQYKRSENENKKFVADSAGDTAVRVLLSDPIVLESGAEFVINDVNGFPVFKVDEDGNVYMKGEVRKIQ